MRRSPSQYRSQRQRCDHAGENRVSLRRPEFRREETNTQNRPAHDCDIRDMQLLGNPGRQCAGSEAGGKAVDRTAEQQLGRAGGKQKGECADQREREGYQARDPPRQGVCLPRSDLIIGTFGAIAVGGGLRQVCAHPQRACSGPGANAVSGCFQLPTARAFLTAGRSCIRPIQAAQRGCPSTRSDASSGKDRQIA